MKDRSHIFYFSGCLSLPDSQDDFCEDALQQKQVKLPEDCAQPGRNTTLYEVGDCASKPCRQANKSAAEQCRDSSQSCCTPSQFETKLVNCTGYEVELIVIKACSCGSCDTTSSVQVSGKVISARSGSPVHHAEVWLNGELETHTNYTGSFYVTVTDSIGTAVFTIKDAYNNTYLDTTKVVEITNGMDGTISVIIQMLEPSDPVIIDSSTEAVLSVGRTQNESGNPVVLLRVPANSFYRNDGSAYTGMVSSSVTFIDPTDDTIQDAIPGVFQFVDEEGATADLESKGLFTLQFQDDEGNALYVDGAIDVSFPDQPAENFTLWKLNAVSGLWEPLIPSVQAYKRKRRQANNRIGVIDISRVPLFNTVTTYLNVDRRFSLSSSERWCYFKGRIYKDLSLSEEIINDNAAYSIKFKRFESWGYVSFRSVYRFVWALRWFCLGVPCGNYVGQISLNSPYLYYMYYGRNYQKIKAAQPKSRYNILTYELSESSTTIGVSMVASYYGPFYTSAYTCAASNIAQSHLRFYKPWTPDIYTARYFSPGGLPFGVNRRLMDTVWYPKRGSLHMICLMKIKITFTKSLLPSETPLKFHVYSFGGDHPDIKGFLFGIREYDVDISRTTQYVCAEYKCSGNLEQSNEKDYTLVKIALVSWSLYRCQVQDISGNIVSYSLNDHLRNPYRLKRPQYAEAYVPDDYSSSLGVYEAHTHRRDFVTARYKVNNACMKTYNQRNEGAFVHFHCPPMPSDKNIKETPSDENVKASGLSVGILSDTVKLSAAVFLSRQWYLSYQILLVSLNIVLLAMTRL